MPRIKQEPLTKFYNEDSNLLEIGIDEAGRGPLFGRVYTAAVILPKDIDFDFEKMKDSKKFSSKKKINEVAEHIKEKALYWSVTYNDETVIDTINIRQSVLKSMHQSIKNIITEEKEYLLLVDGNDFRPFMRFKDDELYPINHICIEGGDNKYCAIAAASILAKVQRDQYIEDLCSKYPLLDEYYGLSKNKGYGTKQHMEGLKKYGITGFHRASFSPCKDKPKIDLQITQ